MDQFEFEFDEEAEYTPLVHKGNRQPRVGVFPEYVFLSRWQALMGSRVDEDEEAPFTEMLRHLRGYPTQRDATTAADFITWLGTNAGRSYLSQAKNLFNMLREHPVQWGPSHTTAYVMTWTVVNTRISYTNNGVRAMEWWYIDDKGQDAIFGPTHVPELSARDVEVVEHVAYWLGTDAGQDFIESCEREIDAVQKYKRRVQTAHMGDTMDEIENCVTGPEIAVLLHVMRHTKTQEAA